MGEELPDGDLLRALVVKAGNIASDRVIQAQLPIVDQHLHGGTGQWLRHGADVEDRVRCHRDRALAISPAERLVRLNAGQQPTVFLLH